MSLRLREIVSCLILSDACTSFCLRGKAAELETFIKNLDNFSADEKKQCIMTSLSILMVADEAQPGRIRSEGIRKRFKYFVPFVGRVCKASFMACFDISATTVARYRAKIEEGQLK
jgi:hypothetical protein